jgi:hypothetical protein
MHIKKILLSLSLLAITATGFSENFTLENKTRYPTRQSKIAVQWATSAREVDENNKAIIMGTSLNANSLQIITRPGKVKLNVPEKTQYFRVVVWSQGEGEPDFITNWIDIVPNKTYKLTSDHLVPSVLMQGSGC